MNMTRSSRSGFTLVEVLVTVTIIAALAAIILSVTRKLQQSAAASNRLSAIHQAGSLLLGLASENNGRCSYFAGGNSAWDYRHYLILRNEMGAIKETGASGKNTDYVAIMHWDATRLPPGANPHWNCRAINFQSVTYPDGSTTKWTQESVKNRDGTSANVKSLSLASVSRPGDYPLLIDSSSANGKEIFRVSESTGDFVGLRESGKASAFLFDGSARLMSKVELKKAGFTKAYDNSATPPKALNL